MKLKKVKSDTEVRIISLVKVFCLHVNSASDNTKLLYLLSGGRARASSSGDH